MREADGEIERASAQCVVLGLTRGQVSANGGDVRINDVVGDDTLAIVADSVDDDPKAILVGVVDWPLPPEVAAAVRGLPW